jgi:hypothetical protein
MVWGVRVVLVVLLFEFEVSSSDSNKSGGCPVWSDSNCQCGRFKRHIIRCEGDYLKIQNCNCVWYDQQRGVTVVSACPHTCYNTQPHGTFYYYIKHTANYTEFNQQMCSSSLSLGIDLHRDHCVASVIMVLWSPTLLVSVLRVCQVSPPLSHYSEVHCSGLWTTHHILLCSSGVQN